MNNTPQQFDLIITAGRILLPDGLSNAPGSVAIIGDRIVAVGENIADSAKRQLDFPDGILLPGLVDFHAHPARSHSKYGVDPDRYLLPQGITTVMSQGDAGAETWEAYRTGTIERSKTRVRLAINVAACGEAPQEPCCSDLRQLDVDIAVAAIESSDGLIWGVAVNTSTPGCGESDPREVQRRALAIAEATGKPLLYGMRDPHDWSFAEQMEPLRPGDVVTYSYRQSPHNICESGQVDPAIREARDRGILFDVCHGKASFSFETAERAIADDFPPETLSSDFYSAHLDDTPGLTLPLHLSKLLAAGLDEHAVFHAVTRRPAEILGLADEIGTLEVGRCADVCVLQYTEEPTTLTDVVGETRIGRMLETKCVLRDGLIV
ncbi:MAG: hypothetical protein O2955_13810 [Planctomycetota bacterium]|nr:hypothetical protein [Planctomycetota bacterium]MDA1213586.1 hypothetical protein [Planctomycetota bacterium]